MDRTASEFRHAVRGALNALKLCVSAFELPLSTSEKLEFLSDIEVAADKVAALMGSYEAMAIVETTPVQSDVR
jgi:hypothetical protein